MWRKHVFLQLDICETIYFGRIFYIFQLFRPKISHIFSIFWVYRTDHKLKIVQSHPPGQSRPILIRWGLRFSDVLPSTSALSPPCAISGDSWSVMLKWDVRPSTDVLSRRPRDGLRNGVGNGVWWGLEEGCWTRLGALRPGGIALGTRQYDS